MTNYVDPNPTRVDYLKFSEMEAIHEAVVDVWEFASTFSTDAVGIVEHIRNTTIGMDDFFEGKISPNAYHNIGLLLRRLGLLARDGGKTVNEKHVNYTVKRIIEIVQGDNEMDKNKLIAMVYRRVIEAMNMAEHGAVCGYGRGPSASDIAEDTATRIVEDVFGGGKTELSEFVDKYYTMDPETEDVLHNGTLVVDGMKILIENPVGREEIHDGMEQVEIYDAKKSNRWATVTESRVLGARGEGSNLSFVGVYDDGVKMRVDRPVSAAWIVKKDSIPRTDYVIHYVEGYIVAQGPTAKVVEDLKNASAAERERYRVQTGKDGDIFTVDEYLFAEGAMAKPPEDGEKSQEPIEYVVDAKGLGSVKIGQKRDILNFLSLQPHDFVSGATVHVSGSNDGQHALAFIEENSERQESTDYEVYAKGSGTTKFSQKHDVLRWLTQQPSYYLSVATVLHSSFDAEGVQALKFLHDNGLSVGIFTVYNEHGATVFEGPAGNIVAWASELSEQGDKYAGFEICPKGKLDSIYSLKEFIKEHAE